MTLSTGRSRAPLRCSTGRLRIDGREIPVSAETDPVALPWGEVGAEVVIESSGFFRDRAGAAKHLEAGRAR